MTYQAIETSREDGNVLELFKFTFGAVTTRLTSYNQDVVFQGSTWTSIQISRDDVQNSIEDTLNEIKITMPASHPIPEAYISNVPGRVGSVEVFRAHADDPVEETVLDFQGFISQVNFDAALVATLTCQPNSSVFKRTAPRFTYQSNCNHILYDAGCKIARSSFLHTALVNAISGRTITVAGLSAKGVGWAVGGFVVFPAAGNDDARLILEQSGDTVTLLNTFAADVLNTTVDVFAGCDHSLAICDSKFANVINFGGFPFVPTKNPFNSMLRGGK